MAFDVTNPTDLATLKNAVETDPHGFGVTPASPTADILAALNTSNALFTVSKPAISSADVRSVTTYEAYNTLSIDEQEWIRWVTATGAGFGDADIPVTTDLRTQLVGGGPGGSIWASAHRTAMEAAFLALIDVQGSWAEDLFGYGTTISDRDWFAARDS